jgi:E3 ubiquitin-protein ligase RAD18
VEDSEEEQDLETKSETAPEDGLVECPLGCGKRMKEAEVFNHLDKCEDEKKQASRSKSKTAMSGGAYQSRSNPVARPEDRINELNYGMMNPTQLSKKLKEQGISNAGSKQLMINRHREWVNIWNANCDSSTPRSRRELLRELDIWERTQGSKAPQGNGLTNTVMRKDFDGDAYAKRHHDEFSRLIADAKRKNMIATTISTEDDADGRAGLVETKESQQHGRPPEDASEPANIDYKPYAHDPEALSNLHDKVQAMREGHVPEPRMNKGFQMPQPVSLASPVDDHQPSMFNTTIAPPIAESDPRQTELPMNITSSDPISLNESLMEKTSKGQHSNEAQLPAEFPRQNSRDEHTAHRLTGSVCDLPVHVLSSSPKKVPMFALPEQPVTDVDGGETHGI